MRTSPTDLVVNADKTRKTSTWFDKLPVDDQVYVKNVVEILKTSPTATAENVSVSLVRELAIKTNPHTVARTLRGMING